MKSQYQSVVDSMVSFLLFGGDASRLWENAPNELGASTAQIEDAIAEFAAY